MQENHDKQIRLFCRNSQFARALGRWFAKHRRDLPWRMPMGTPRSARPDPYCVLVSETMLQQTQVTTVIPFFNRFIERFPTVHELAYADEQQVLRLWQGLGYYSRARNLRKAGIEIVKRFNGIIPSKTEALLKLPGIGQYTAGAIASIAFDARVPALDGNVTRVLCRLAAIETNPREKETSRILWSIAQKILPRKNCGVFNEALMELGATLCTPRNPNCPACPVRAHCEAAERGIQHAIPVPKRTRPTPLESRWAYVIRNGRGELLIEQRPSEGRWAGMWQFITLRANGLSPRTALSRALQLKRIGELKTLGELSHQLTHRRYHFRAFAANIRSPLDDKTRRWVSPEELERYPFSKPQLAIAKMALSLRR